ncbi:MAG: SUMF1/EgtB/PvdO family nonheme iron enzyme [Cyanothece sp. SIO2G6]|nr:SUMF1/EgtB/PvdO family nonheme iron enzyme [Cyanothece sp. SIO2G6]
MAKKFALTIGVNHYQYEELRSLQCAANDAIAMSAFFQRLAFDEVLVYSDDTPDYHPELTSLRRGIRRISTGVRLGPEDSFWFFFSGHGGRQQGRDFLLPSNGDPEDLAYSAIAIDDVIRSLRQCGAGNLVLILDACRNVVPEYDKGLGSQTVELVKQEGIITLFSCSPGEKSYELPDRQQGAFTYALLRGMQGEYAPNRCNARQLEDYLLQTVPSLTQQYGRQRPYVIAEPLHKGMQLLLPTPQSVASPTPLPTLAPESVGATPAKLTGTVVKLIRQANRAMRSEDWGKAKALWQQIIMEANDPEDRKLALEEIAYIAQQQTSSIPTSLPILDPPAPSHDLVSLPIDPTPTESETATPTFSFTTVRVNDSGEIVEQIEKTAEFFTEDLGNGVSFDMVKIPGGSFMMGSPDGEGWGSEKPQHQVLVSSFYMGKYVVTQSLYEAVMGTNPATQYDGERFVNPNKPVIGVSWSDAVTFCHKLSQLTNKIYRLPSEAEWEYACRAGTKTPFHCGPTITTAIANYNGNYSYSKGSTGEYRAKITPVGSFSPNAFGLFDMHGNVWEWCVDYLHENYKGAPNDGSAWIQGGKSHRRIRRGGSWYVGPDGCRSVYRYSDLVDTDNNGFRVLLVPTHS